MEVVFIEGSKTSLLQMMLERERERERERGRDDSIIR